MKTKILFLPLFFLLVISVSKAQDLIHTKTTVIKAKVIEIGLDEIKYKDFDNLDGPVIVIDKRDVLDITYENGKKTVFAKDEYDASPELDVRDKKHVIKFEIFSPLGGDLAFGYETVMKVGTNLEFKLGIIGAGFNEYDDASGVWLKAGVKFLTSPNYYHRGVKRSHSLNGWYFKPEVIYNTFSTGGHSFTNGAMNLVFGNQHLLGNTFTLDYYAGLGYGFQSGSGSYDRYDGNVYSHIYGGRDFPLVLTGGFTLGVIF